MSDNAEYESPFTGSLKTICICETAEFRGLGDTGAIVTVGGAVSTAVRRKYSPLVELSPTTRTR